MEWVCRWVKVVTHLLLVQAGVHPVLAEGQAGAWEELCRTLLGHSLEELLELSDEEDS